MRPQEVELEWAGRILRLETGRLARQADASVICRYGDTMALATVGVSEDPVEANFLPLRVDFEEKMYAVGRIPGGFFKREGRPSDEAVLTARRIDRPIRPLIPDDIRHEIQIIATPLSAEQGCSIDLVSMIASAAAVQISSVPTYAPFGVAAVGHVGGEIVINPSFAQVEEGDWMLLVAATREGIIMIEMRGRQATEAALIAGLEIAFEECQKIIGVIEQLQEKAGKEKADLTRWQPRPEIVEAVRQSAYDRLCQALELPTKLERHQAIRQITLELNQSLAEQYDSPQQDIEAALQSLTAERLKHVVLEEGRRFDGRAFDELRPVSCEVGLLPRAHGSGLFQRGETQVLTITTLGATHDQRLVRTLEEEDYERFMHHYDFPPYAAGEVRPLRQPSRREIGHGALAQNAIEAVLPAEDEFPYTIRLVSEVLESNGSTSMAAVCGSTLALMDAGVPIRAPVAGISIGLVWDGRDRYRLLTDIQGVEDFEGFMDLKVAGTRLGVTAIQMDTKTQGLPISVIAEGLEMARVARAQILDVMAETLPYPRPELSPHAPRLFIVTIDPSKIGLLIGPGGRVVRRLQDEYDVEIDIRDDGTVYVFGAEGEMVERARDAIIDLTREVEVGEVFTGRVISTTPFGAFVEILPGREGLLHISNLAWEHVERTEDVVKPGDTVQVKVVEVDPEGRIRLSRKDLLPRPPREDERRGPDSRRGRSDTPGHGRYRDHR
ncbi:MAG: polyribonucleotide nucleotidyltransferase [Armatimonadetes bacterium]|nr:polyribonucleotide nucleotidyltransferase [Armatimonadota bacterium]